MNEIILRILTEKIVELEEEVKVLKGRLGNCAYANENCLKEIECLKKKIKETTKK